MVISNYTINMGATSIKTLSLKSTQQEEQSSTKEQASLSAVRSTELREAKGNWEALKKSLTKEVIVHIARKTDPVLNGFEEFYSASELSYQMQAKVQTDEGMIELSLEINLKSSFTRRRLLSSRFTDPLAISFNGSAVGLSGKKISFDIDADGRVDEISALKRGQGYLALDKNENGKIDDASELFGAFSGDGFSDLAKFDDDKNGFIDKNDSIFSKLRVWENDGERSRLLALGEVGVGAIYLGSIKSDYEFRNSFNNELLGAVRSSGFAISERGETMHVAQVDLAKFPPSTSIEFVAKKLNERLSGGIKNLKIKRTSFEEFALNVFGKDDARNKLLREIAKHNQKLAQTTDGVQKQEIKARISAAKLKLAELNIMV
ncbi:hypothetical protein [Campylobacter sp. 19-13652]|uniref:hypothetical protein n=1 Tax=Campylobacter sp. 19-13652 TaxID=2840180 RepID=UPI001C78BD03|nr:hypothetical protein [Campylobacter sp. 19-13652]BCX78922.1 hypothetical protein LBC_03840 [Campylobacter sp. 19-13652]